MDDYRPLSKKELERGYFFLEHRPVFIKIGYGLAIFVLVILYGIVFYNIYGILTGTSYNESAVYIAQNRYDWSSYHQARQPQELKIDKANFLALGGRRYNLVAFIENPNPDWSVEEIEYKFVVNDKEIPVETSFLNPDEKKMLIKTGYEPEGPIRKLDLIIGNIKWRRDENDLPKIDIVIKNINFFPATRVTQGETTTEIPARVTWQAENASLYNMWEVGFQVALFNGSSLVAINQSKVRDFLSLEEEEVEAVWINDLPRVTGAEVYLDFNKLNFDNYKDLYIEPGGDDRIRI